MAIYIKTKGFQRKTEVFCIVFLRTCCYNTITVKQTGTQEGKRWQRLCVFNKQIKRKFKEGIYNEKKISELSTCNSNDHIIYGGNAVFASDDTATEETAERRKMMLQMIQKNLM